MLLDKLPQKRTRKNRGGTDIGCITVRVRVVTPILGGSAKPRELDDIDGIRPSTIRGHLRFWWRALNAHTCKTSKELFEMESSLWGGAANDGTARSQVDLNIEVDQDLFELIDNSDVKLTQTRGAYALWTARGMHDTAPRRKSGVEFRMTLSFPEEKKDEICNAVRAWILFGGYGGRTRRGLGSLTIIGTNELALPLIPKKSDIVSIFGHDIFAASSMETRDVPILAGASLYVGNESDNAERAWQEALDWLKDFRQGTTGSDRNRAREPGSDKLRPSISNWPEPDKIRHLSKPKDNLPWAHSASRHNNKPVWPRAGFGLPINGRFQSNSRNKGADGKPIRWDKCSPPRTEPGNFELVWRNGSVEHERLASPLILKALALSNGKFVPIALWLNRSYPEGEVILKGTPRSAAPFDKLTADGDQVHFEALENKSGLRQAFLDWLRETKGAKVISP
jgi:CRISPR-associated protein Cmr1